MSMWFFVCLSRFFTVPTVLYFTSLKYRIEIFMYFSCAQLFFRNRKRSKGRLVLFRIYQKRCNFAFHLKTCSILFQSHSYYIISYTIIKHFVNLMIQSESVFKLTLPNQYFRKQIPRLIFVVTQRCICFSRPYYYIILVSEFRLYLTTVTSLPILIAS